MRASWSIVGTCVATAFVTVGTAAQPAAFPAKPAAAVSPIEVLRSAKWFEAVQVGYAGETPAAARAWQRIAHGNTPAAIFASLLISDSAATRLYAIAGLYAFDRQRFREAAAQERTRRDSVMTLVGCIAEKQAIADVVDDIAKGGWSRDFLAGKLGSP